MSSQRVARELLRALRGKRSQVAFSRRLGFKSNVVAPWEAGRRFPTSTLTLAAARLAGAEVDAAFRNFEPTCLPAGHTRADLADWLNRLRGAESVPTISARARLSRHAVGRILRGQTEARLPEFLAVIEAITGRLSDFVAALVDIDRVPSLATDHRAKLAARMVAFSEPWSIPVVRVLETTAYARFAHQPGYLAKLLGIDEATETRCLEKLIEAQVVRWNGVRYEVLRELTVDARANPEGIWRLKRHWAQAAAQFIGREEPPNRFSYNVFSCSARDFERIRERHWDFYHEVRGIVASSTPVEKVGLLTVQLVEWLPADPSDEK